MEGTPGAKCLALDLNPSSARAGCVSEPVPQSLCAGFLPVAWSRDPRTQLTCGGEGSVRWAGRGLGTAHRPWGVLRQDQLLPLLPEEAGPWVGRGWLTIPPAMV